MTHYELSPDQLAAVLAALDGMESSPGFARFATLLVEKLGVQADPKELTPYLLAVALEVALTMAEGALAAMRALEDADPTVQAAALAINSFDESISEWALLSEVASRRVGVERVACTEHADHDGSIIDNTEKET